MATVKEIKREILAALEAGTSTTALEKALQAERLREQTAGEVAELAAIAQKRSDFKARAQLITEKTAKQNEAIAVFMEARRPIMKALEDVRAQAVEMQPLQDRCRAEYGAPVDFLREVRDMPQGYLPPSLTLHSLASGVSGVSEQELTAGVVFHIDAALDILRKCQRLERTLPHLLPESEV
jgi:hypothetical protein